MTTTFSRRLRGLCLLGVAWVTGVASAETFGDLVYQVPPGWAAQRSADSLTLKPQNLAAGEVALITLAKGSAFSGDFAARFEQLSGVGPAGYTLVQRLPPQASQDDHGAPVLARVATFRNASGQTLYIVFVAVHPPGRLEVVTFATSSPQTLQKYQAEVDAFTNSIDYVGAGRAAQGASTSATSSAPPVNNTATPASPTAPSLPVPKLAALVARGFDPAKQPIPDEFRCYPEINSDQYQKATVVLQFLGGDQYRLVVGSAAETGRFAMQKGTAFYDIKFQSGPLAALDDATLFWGRDKEYGQEIKLYRYPLKNDDTVSFECYQRGPRDALAQLHFRRKDPQPGKYPCRSTDGKNTDKGVLEILANKAYRYAGTGGTYRADVLGDQSEDFSSVDFTGGALEDKAASYQEDDLGEREISTLNGMKCTVVVKPTLPPRFGQDRAPAPPKGSGGLSGAYSYQYQQFMPGGGLTLERAFYVFSKNGYVFTGDPETSLADADCTRTFPNGLPVCEVYRVQGSTIVIGQDKPVPLRRQGNGLAVNGHTLEPIRPVGALRLAGDYKTTSVFTTVGGTGGGFSETYLHFRTDGRFTRDHSGGFAMTTTTDGTALGDTTGGVSSSRSRQNSGKYRFADNTLTLSYDDGRTERMFAMLPQLGKDGKPDPHWLYLGGSDYFYQDPKKK